MWTVWTLVFLWLKASCGETSDGEYLSGYGYGKYWPIPPTKGRPWPLPQSERNSTGSFQVDPKVFRFQSVGHDCHILQEAYKRYMKIAFPDRIESHSNRIPILFGNSSLLSLDVNVLTKCGKIPHLHMDEQYQLKICAPDSPSKATLISQSVWGALRGLETFSQLLVRSQNSTTYEIGCTQILDFPRFPFRGLMLDTSRHFLPVDTIKDNLDLMAMNKFNVFHWHIVDDQSFPYESGVYPDLSAKGAYSNLHTYTKKEVADILEYARLRGIRVVTEFDTPGHTRSWGYGQPGLLTECYDNGIPNGEFGPIDPSKEENYEFLKKLFVEIGRRFYDHQIHLGGDEVDFSCWESNPDINAFMEHLNITGNYSKLQDYYFTRLLDIVSAIRSIDSHLVWQEVFDHGNELPKDSTIFHVWKFKKLPSSYQHELEEITAAGYRTLLSACWYLNYISYGPDWREFYRCDPLQFDGTPAQYRLVMGGEACMWGEFVDKTNIIPRTWPRASAVAERLWSPVDSTQSVDEAAPRLEEHRCRLQRRGYPAEPLGPSFCEGIV